MAWLSLFRTLPACLSVSQSHYPLSFHNLINMASPSSASRKNKSGSLFIAKKQVFQSLPSHIPSNSVANRDGELIYPSHVMGADALFPLFLALVHQPQRCRWLLLDHLKKVRAWITMSERTVAWNGWLSNLETANWSIVSCRTHPVSTSVHPRQTSWLRFRKNYMHFALHLKKLWHWVRFQV